MSLISFLNKQITWVFAVSGLLIEDNIKTHMYIMHMRNYLPTVTWVT